MSTLTFVASCNDHWYPNPMNQVGAAVPRFKQQLMKRTEPGGQGWSSNRCIKTGSLGQAGQAGQAGQRNKSQEDHGTGFHTELLSWNQIIHIDFG